MRVLLTGASGFLGGYVLKSLNKRNIEVVAIGRRPPSFLGVSKFIETDILRYSDLYKLVNELKATHLLHLAWYAEHGKYWNSSLNLRWVDASIRIVEAFCKTGGQHIAIAGTCAEYDWSCGYCLEDVTPLKPRMLYGTAKDATRRLVSVICADYEIPFAWSRIFLPYGKGENVQRLIPSLIDVFNGKRSPFAVNLNAYRDFLHAADVAEGLVRLIESQVDGVYNISSGEPVRLYCIVKKLAKILNANPQQVLELATERPNKQQLLVGDNNKLKSIGWNQSLSLEEGLEQTIK